MPAAWVFFDVDQTLCDFAAMMHRALSASLSEIGSRWPELSGRYRPDDLEAIRDRLADAYGDRPVPLVAVRRQMFAEVLAPVGASAAQIDEITEHYLAIRFAEPVIFDDVRPCLELLQGSYQLGVITNGNSKLDSLGLDHFFAVEFAAEAIGFAKPDPRIFTHAARSVGADPAELIMIGDSYEKDVVAARRAGWRALWLRRDTGPTAAGEIGDLRALPALLPG
ncbi:hydrolase [Microlunatus endophyticus]|uniref:Hydrolase n=1 Tax=Microlunatus endophyticus TaxID=1716077 RepID=A0A917SL11_9ACTN|nr:HAD family hydrolase [Microlunatus endophyticus]GGL84194.1 hydrolase [Microlunatus endophyticus]